MSDTQMKRLVEMMSSQSLSPYLDIYIPTLHIKKKHLNTLSKGDVLPLNSKVLKVEIVDDKHILAQGIYGTYQNSRSVLIEDLPTKMIEKFDKKKYDMIKVHLGSIERAKYDNNKIVRLINDSKFDALLYREDNKLLARAALAQIESGMALKIEEIVK